MHSQPFAISLAMAFALAFNRGWDFRSRKDAGGGAQP